MKKVLSILTLLVLIFAGQKVAFNADSESIVLQCNLTDYENTSSLNKELRKFELSKNPLESFDMTARTKPASDNYERLFKLSNSNKGLFFLKLKEQATQYKISETLSTIQTINYSTLRKCGNQWIYVLRKLVI